jgi:PmbA protein
VRGTDMLWVGDGEVSSRPITRPESILEHTLTQLERARENVPVRTRQMPVIFTPDGVAGTLMLPLSVAFSGKNVLQGSSPLAASLGEQLYDERLNIVDDPLLPWRPGSRMADDEGLPARKVTLVENGVVRSFLYDLQTAGQAGTESTASAHRGVPTQPTIASSAIVITPGVVSFDNMVAGIDEGIVVEHVIGASQGNVMGGEFSGNVVLGYKIERGKITGRVKNTMVAGNVHTLFKRIGALGSDARWMGSGLFTPSIMFEQVSVASTE